MWLADQRDKRYFSLCQTVLARDEAHLGGLKSTRIHLCLDANGATFVGGTASNLVNGRAVRIKAQVNAGRLEATEVSFVTS